MVATLKGGAASFQGGASDPSRPPLNETLGGLRSVAPIWEQSTTSRLYPVWSMYMFYYTDFKNANNVGHPDCVLV